MQPRAEKSFEDLTNGTYFLEYIRGDICDGGEQDLEGYQAMGEEKGETKVGLLAADEKTGFPRLVEALQCSMWSNMEKKASPPSFLSEELMTGSGPFMEKRKDA